MSCAWFVRVMAVVFALVLGIGRAGAADPPLTIGFGMALTGGIAANGRAALIAMKLWEEDTNKSGGLLGRPVDAPHAPFPGPTRGTQRRDTESKPHAMGTRLYVGNL